MSDLHKQHSKRCSMHHWKRWIKLSNFDPESRQKFSLSFWSKVYDSKVVPTFCVFFRGMGAISILSFLSHENIWRFPWTLSVVHRELWPHPDFIDFIVRDISVMTTSLQFETKSLPLNVSFPTEISFPQLLFELKGSVRSCNLLKHCPDLVALQTPVLTQHDVFTLVADKPARLASVTICQIRCKKTNSETVTMSIIGHKLIWGKTRPNWPREVR